MVGIECLRTGEGRGVSMDTKKKVFVVVLSVLMKLEKMCEEIFFFNFAIYTRCTPPM